MKKLISPIIAMLIVMGSTLSAHAFCGFFVAKADANIFNNKSEVVIVRNGEHSVVTMKSDFDGDLKEFAMVVPVPVVLKREQIRTMDPSIISKLDAYSAPRMAEYHDPKPCQPVYHYNDISIASESAQLMSMSVKSYEAAPRRKLKVKIEAKYAVDEYDILILSSKESGDLEIWLRRNGYKLPENAKEVLEPYIKNDMKFFVVKINTARMKNPKSKELSPLQLAYKSKKFMLPIRLGMANANGDQDMIVHIFTKKGRAECSNYRTVKIPTNNEIPTFVEAKFGEFYKDTYNQAWKKEEGKAVMLEYAWNITGTQPVKCDPCPAPVLAYKDLRELGVYWVGAVNNSMSQGAYIGDLFVTRLHVRYNRKNYPQDLTFTETPNMENFQGRYVIRHAAGTNFTCSEAKGYYAKVATRRQKELDELASLTGWDITGHKSYVEEYAKLSSKTSGSWIDVNDFGVFPSGMLNDMKWLLVLVFAAGTGLMYKLYRKRTS